MKKLLIILLILTPSIVFAQDTKQQPQKQKAEQAKPQTAVEYVHICNGPNSKKYHRNAWCRGLSKCSTAIQKITKTEAVKKGRTACAICYK